MSHTIDYGRPDSSARISKLGIASAYCFAVAVLLVIGVFAGLFGLAGDMVVALACCLILLVGFLLGLAGFLSSKMTLPLDGVILVLNALLLVGWMYLIAHTQWD